MVQHASTMFFATPLLDANGEVVAVFTVRFEPAFELTRITETGRPGESGETYAIDENGRLLTVSRFEESLIDAGIVTQSGTVDTSLQGLRVADPRGNHRNYCIHDIGTGMGRIGHYRQRAGKVTYKSLECAQENISTHTKQYCMIGTFFTFFVNFCWHIPRFHLSYLMVWQVAQLPR